MKAKRSHSSVLRRRTCRRRKQVWSPGIPGNTARWREMIWCQLLDFPPAGRQTDKWKETPVDPRSGIQQDQGDGDGRGCKLEQDSEQFSLGAKLSLHPNVWSAQCAGRWLSSLFLGTGTQQPPPKRRGMCCDCYLGGTSAISVLQAQALAGHPSYPDIQLVPPSAWGGLQPTGPATATCEAACWGAREHS